jgi:uncharacterized protein (DUF58 family)
MNNRSLVLVLILCGLIISALMVRNGKILLLVLPFLVYLFIGIIQAPSEITLVADRIISKSNLIPQELFETRIVIKNQGKTLVNLHLRDTLFPSITILDGKAISRLSLSTGESTELNYVSKAERGVYSWKSIHICACDPFELFELERDIPAIGEIQVRPAPVHIHNVPVKPRATLHAAGPISARLAGSGTDFWGIREYRTGDSLRRLNWRLSARHPRKIFTNEYEQEEIADFGLILDARRITTDAAMEEGLFEHSVSATASLAENFLKRGNRVALLIFGGAIVTLFPGYGKRQLNAVLRNLARAKLGENLPLSYLEYFPVRLFPSRSQIVMISTVDSRDLETYARLRAYGYDVLLISPDPVDYAAQILPPNEIKALAVRAARIERVIQLKRLLKMGVEVIDWQISHPLDAIIQTGIRYMSQRRNI